MPYVRKLDFTVPTERVEELSPGHNLYLATVFGTQIAAQNVQGYQKGGVWMQRQQDGSIKVTMFSQFSEIDGLQTYAKVPMITDFVKDITTYLSPVVLEVYEVLG
jgi:hypothetical protein